MTANELIPLTVGIVLFVLVVLGLLYVNQAACGIEDCVHF